jgi:pyruvate dehydrogenase E1 component alpha subunit
MPGVRVTENDPDLVFEVVGDAVARARAGAGPTLLEVKVDRLYGHFQGDPETYRPKGEVESLRKKDSLAAYEARLKTDGVVTDATATEIRGRARERVEAAIVFARQSDYPPAAEAFQHVFQESAS